MLHIEEILECESKQPDVDNVPKHGENTLATASSSRLYAFFRTLNQPQGNDLVGYVKEMPDGTVLYVEEERPGRRTLAFKSICKEAATSNVDAIAKTLTLNA